MASLFFLSLRARAVLGFSFMLAMTSACGGPASPAHRPGAGGSGPAEVGKLAPPLAIQSLDGKGTIALTPTPGKITVVDFFATWCAPCKKSLPKLEQMAKQSGGTVQVIAISVDDTRTGVADFAKAQGVTFPVAWDENHTLARKWSVEKMPTTYIIDGTGTVRFMHSAYQESESEVMGKELAQLTSERSATKPNTEVASATLPTVAPVAAPAPAAAPVAEEPKVEPVADVAPTSKGSGKEKPGAGKKAPARKKKPTTAAAGKAAFN